MAPGEERWRQMQALRQQQHQLQEQQQQQQIQEQRQQAQAIARVQRQLEEEIPTSLQGPAASQLHVTTSHTPQVALSSAGVRDGAGTPQTPPVTETSAGQSGSGVTPPSGGAALAPEALQRAREAEEQKKQRRRMYQQKRRQSQGKEAGVSKKRPRKGSKLEEDYDAFLETLMSQLAALPALSVQEPPVPACLAVVAPPGAGRHALRLGRPDYKHDLGELRARDGDTLELREGAGDYYGRRPFGDRQPRPTTHTLGRTILGFYEQEFPSKDEIIPCRRGRGDGAGGGLTPARDADSPDTVISSSSPETVVPDCSYRYPVSAGRGRGAAGGWRPLSGPVCSSSSSSYSTDDSATDTVTESEPEPPSPEPESAVAPSPPPSPHVPSHLQLEHNYCQPGRAAAVHGGWQHCLYCSGRQPCRRHGRTASPPRQPSPIVVFQPCSPSEAVLRAVDAGPALGEASPQHELESTVEESLAEAELTEVPLESVLPPLSAAPAAAEAAAAVCEDAADSAASSAGDRLTEKTKIEAKQLEMAENGQCKPEENNGPVMESRVSLRPAQGHHDRISKPSRPPQDHIIKGRPDTARQTILSPSIRNSAMEYPEMVRLLTQDTSTQPPSRIQVIDNRVQIQASVARTPPIPSREGPQSALDAAAAFRASAAAGWPGAASPASAYSATPCVTPAGSPPAPRGERPLAVELESRVSTTAPSRERTPSTERDQDDPSPGGGTSWSLIDLVPELTSSPELAPSPAPVPVLHESVLVAEPVPPAEMPAPERTSVSLPASSTVSVQTPITPLQEQAEDDFLQFLEQHSRPSSNLKSDEPVAGLAGMVKTEAPDILGLSEYAASVSESAVTPAAGAVAEPAAAPPRPEPVLIMNGTSTAGGAACVAGRGQQAGSVVGGRLIVHHNSQPDRPPPNIIRIRVLPPTRAEGEPAPPDAGSALTAQQAQALQKVQSVLQAQASRQSQTVPVPEGSRETSFAGSQPAAVTQASRNMQSSVAQSVPAPKAARHFHNLHAGHTGPEIHPKMYGAGHPQGQARAQTLGFSSALPVAPRAPFQSQSIGSVKSGALAFAPYVQRTSLSADGAQSGAAEVLSQCRPPSPSQYLHPPLSQRQPERPPPPPRCPPERRPAYTGHAPPPPPAAMRPIAPTSGDRAQLQVLGPGQLPRRLTQSHRNFTRVFIGPHGGVVRPRAEAPPPEQQQQQPQPQPRQLAPVAAVTAIGPIRPWARGRGRARGAGVLATPTNRSRGRGSRARRTCSCRSCTGGRMAAGYPPSTAAARGRPQRDPDGRWLPLGPLDLRRMGRRNCRGSGGGASAAAVTAALQALVRGQRPSHQQLTLLQRVLADPHQLFSRQMPEPLLNAALDQLLVWLPQMAPRGHGPSQLHQRAPAPRRAASAGRTYQSGAAPAAGQRRPPAQYPPRMQSAASMTGGYPADQPPGLPMASYHQQMELLPSSTAAGAAYFPPQSEVRPYRAGGPQQKVTAPEQKADAAADEYAALLDAFFNTDSAPQYQPRTDACSTSAETYQSRSEYQTRAYGPPCVPASGAWYNSHQTPADVYAMGSYCATSASYGANMPHHRPVLYQATQRRPRLYQSQQGSQYQSVPQAPAPLRPRQTPPQRWRSPAAAMYGAGSAVWPPRAPAVHQAPPQTVAPPAAACVSALDASLDPAPTLSAASFLEELLSSATVPGLLSEPLPATPSLPAINPDLDLDSWLKLIEDDWLEPPDGRAASPDIPLIAPIPVRPRPGVTAGQLNGMDKENSELSLKSHLGIGSPLPLRDSGQVTVTLTLTSEAAHDVGAVLRSLAALLNIPPPSGYQVIERTGTPPSQKLGLYRHAKGKHGRDQVVDIQTILNGPARFCQHCEVVILSDIITKQKWELPVLRQPEQLADQLHFCSSACLAQFSSSQLTPAASAERRAAAVVDHTGRHGLSAAADPFTQELLSVRERQLSRHESGDSQRRRSGSAASAPEEPGKRWKNIRYRTWTDDVTLPKKHRRPTDNELTQLLFQMGICIMPSRMPDEVRRCLFCHMIGDAMSDGPARLLNFDVDKWVHLNCALWADDVYETESGSLVNVDMALKKSLNATCTLCKETGASIKCFKVRCDKTYHLTCSIKDKCTFYKNKTVYCREHIPKGEKDNELTTLAVYRRVYIEREEDKQVAVVMHQAGSDQSHLLRVGTLIFLSVGQLLPHQLASFHTGNYIYPIGYKIIRLYWSFRRVNKRCQYICSIQESGGLPLFQIVVREPSLPEMTFVDATCLGVWKQVLRPLRQCRDEAGMVRLFPQYVTGEDLFGLTEPSIIKILESLPGIDTLTDYRFKYGRNPLLELPLAINPTGCARSEAKLRTHFKRPHTQRPSGGHSRALAPMSYTSDSSAPYSKQFVHSRSSQYKKMKLEWRNNVYLARSKIQGLGLYAARTIEKFTMIIEYIGEVVRNEIADVREKRYEAANRGIYMFRLDPEHVVDATLSGGLARYVNHSCNPNCVTESVEVDRGHHKIIIFANRRIQRGEELAYDYKFDIEDDSNKIPCLCGAPNCRKWMN